MSQLTVLLVLAVLAALLAPAAASGANGRHVPKASTNRWLNDPRSGALLNLLAARNPGFSPGKMFTGPKFISTGTVNNPAADSTAQDTQSETTIAAIGSGVTVGFNDSGSFLGGASHFTGYAHSTDNGANFTDEGTLPASANGDAGDPVLAADQSAGVMYMSALDFNTTNTIQVFKSTDGGATFGAPVDGTGGSPSGDEQDKSWMTVDNYSGAGQHNVYLCWTRFGAAEDIHFTSSTNGGASFGPASGQILSAGGQGCFVTVSPDHSVSVFYYRGTGGGGQGGDNKIFMRRSTNFGATFGPEVQVADLLSTTTNGDLGLAGGFRTNSFPHAAVNPVNGNMYVVYNDNPADSDNGDIFYVKSTDSGATWSAPVQVNNDDAGRDQFMPTVAVSPNGARLMFGYYSRANDGFDYHRQSRIGVITLATGAVALHPSFQLGPDTPVVKGQDPVINATYMGDYDQIAATTGFFHTSWADNRSGNSFHANQPDVYYARVNSSAPTTDPAVTLSGPATATVGSTITVTVTVTNPGVHAAQDVFANVTMPSGLVPQSTTQPAAGKCYVVGQLVGCNMQGITPGASKHVVITVLASASGNKTTRAAVTTSGTDTDRTNNAATLATSVTGTGVTKTYSSGNIAVPINDNSTVDIPVNVGDAGSILSVSGRVRLNHTFDGDVSLALVSPTGTIVDLSSRNGGSGDNYGTGNNDCTGTKTVFSDGAATPITGGTPPYAGTFAPEQSQSAFSGEQQQGVWKLRVTDSASADTGVVGCVGITINRS